MADHNIEINVQLHDEDAIDKLRELSRMIDKFKASRTVDIRTNVDMSGLNRMVSVLQTASNLASGLSSVFQGMSNFAGGIGSAFTGMSNLFKVDLLNTSKRYLTAMATRAVTGSIGDMISRYDILSTFTPYMQIAGVDARTANTALQRVNQSILGLPIGLDEAAYRLRRYQMFVGDTEQATNLTIGLQNALTAGGASQSMKNTAYMEMERLLTSGDLATWRQWQALITGFGVSSRFIADAMSEISGRRIDVTELARELHEGTISADELLQALEYMGQDWSTVPASQVPKFVTDMNEALDIYKGTIEAWQSNIQFAVTRGGTNLLNALNDAMKAEQGMGIVDVLSNVRDLINDVFSAGSEFVGSHPEMLQTAFDIVGGLMERAKGFDWELFSTNVIQNIGTLFDILFSAFDSLPPGALEEFASFAMTIAGPIGSLFKAVQSGLPFMLGVFERFKDFDFGMLVEDITHQVEVFAHAIETLLNVVGDEKMSELLSFALVWGTPLAKGLGALAQGLGMLSNATIAFGEHNPFKWLVESATEVQALLPGVLPLLGTIGGVAALLGGVGIVETNYRREQHENAVAWWAEEIGDSLNALNETAPLLESVAANRSNWQKGFDEITAETNMAAELVENIRATNDRLMSSSLTAQERAELRESLQSEVSIWNELFPDMTMTSGGASGALSASSTAFVNDMAQSYIELSNAKAFVDATAEARSGTIQDIVAQEAQLEALRASREEQWASARQARLALRQERENLVNFDTGESDNILLREQQLAKVEQAEENLRVATESASETSSQINELSASIEESYELLDQYNLSWQQYSETVRKLSREEFRIDGDIVQWDEIPEDIQKLITAYEALREEARETVEDQIAMFDELERNADISTSAMVNGLESQKNAYEDFNESLGEIVAFIIGLQDNPEAYDLYSGFFGRILSEGPTLDAMEQIDKISDLITGENFDLLSKIVGDEKNVEMLQDANASLAGLIQSLTNPDMATAFVENQDLFGELGITQEQIDAIQQAADYISGMDFSESTEQVDEVSGSLDEATGAADGASSAIDKVTEATEAAGEAASSKSGQIGSFAGALRGVQSSAAMAASAMARLAAAINALPTSKNVTVSVNGAFATGINSGVGAVASRVYNAANRLFGGASYPAEGGYVEDAPHKGIGPIGTDTIPAWLTPGEFVVKRGAAQMFGPTFLEKVNGMDINGAFDALMHNIARPGGMYMPNVTYNRDNHASVNIHNYGETGQGYSQMKAYKWASRL